MKHIQLLPRLPLEAAELVNQGIYSMYTARGNEAAYLLATMDCVWWLRSDGSVLSRYIGAGLADVIAHIDEPVMFYE